MGAANSNLAVSQRSALRPPVESADNGYSYGAAITSLSANQADTEAPADFEDSAAASLVGGASVGELRRVVTGRGVPKIVVRSTVFPYYFYWLLVGFW